MIRTAQPKTRTSEARPETLRKAKRSYSLSQESVQFLESLRRGRPDASVSSILDEILLATRRSQERAALERSVESYYDSFTDSDIAEDREWGEFALRQFTLEDPN